MPFVPVPPASQTFDETASTASAVLRWLQVLEHCGPSASPATMDRKVRLLSQWPDLTEHVLAAASRDPEDSLRRWSACSQLASPERFRVWMKSELQTKTSTQTGGVQVDLEILRLMLKHLTADDVEMVPALLETQWVVSPISDELIQFVESPFGQVLYARVLELLRKGVYRHRPNTFLDICIDAGDRTERWLEAAMFSGQPLGPMGFDCGTLFNAKLEPVLLASALCQLPADWKQIVAMGLSRFETGDDGEIAWPRTVLKTFLANHPDKEVRFRIIKLLTPSEPSLTGLSTPGQAEATLDRGKAPVLPANSSATGSPERPGLMKRFFG